MDTPIVQWIEQHPSKVEATSSSLVGGLQLCKNDKLATGKKVEELFSDLALERGWSVTEATKDQDMNEHWDRLIHNNGKGFKVDIKGRKSIHMGNAKQDNEIWIELHGVREYDKGWLHGKANLIAFEVEHGFYICQRKDLLELVYKLVDFNTIVLSPYDALYKLYHREGRKHDLLTRILLTDLEYISCSYWSKQNENVFGSFIY